MATSNSNNSGANNSALKDVESLTRGLRAAATESMRAARAAAKLEKSMEEASNAALDKAAAAMASLAKQSGLLEDALKEEIKAHKQSPRELAKVIDRMEKKGDALVKAQDAYTKSINDIRAQHKQALKAAKGDRAAEVTSRSNVIKATKQAQKEFQAQLNELGVTAGIASKGLEQLISRAKSNKSAITKVATDLEKPSARIGKALEGMHSRVQDSVMGLGRFGVAMELARKAVTEVWGQSVRLAGKGLVGSMIQMNMSALKLKMTAEEFEALVSSNRDMIAVMGGGAQGIAKFEEVLTASSVGLEALGKDGKKAAAVMLAGFNKAGFGLMSSNKDVSNAYASNIKSLNKQFKLFNGIFGDTAEEFTSLYEQQLMSEEVQAKLISGDTKMANLQLQEIMTRTQSLKLMGLNNQQIVEMTKRVDATFNPRKNRQADAQIERVAARQAVASGARAISDTDAVTAKTLMDFVSSGEMARVQQMSSGDQKKYMAENINISKAIATMNETITAQRDKDGTDTSNKGNVYVDRAEAAGAEFEKWRAFGMDLRAAENRGNDQTQEGMNKRIVEGYKNSLSDVNGETTELGKSFGRLRDAVDQVTSIMGSPFTSVFTAFGAGVLAASSTIRGAVANTASKLLKSATSFSTGVGGLLKKVVGGIGRWLIAFGFDKLFGMAGGGGNKIDEEKDDDNWSRMTTLEKAQSGTARGIEKVGSFFGLDNVVNTAQAGRIDRESSYLKDRKSGFTLPPQAAMTASTNKSNEAAMLKALTDKGITDPKQQAMLMGQLSHESGGFTQLQELGGRSYFDKYEGRRDLGNTSAGDGYNYRGRGFIQLTGKSNYEQAGKALGMDLVNNPDQASNPEVAAKIAAWYLTKERKGGSSADLAARGDFVGLTKSINGGTNGIDDRSAKTISYLKAVNSGGPALVTPGQALKTVTPAPEGDAEKKPAPATQQATPASVSTTTTYRSVNSDPTLSEMQKQTTLLSTMVALLGKSSGSARSYQLDPATGANVAS